MIDSNVLELTRGEDLRAVFNLTGETCAFPGERVDGTSVPFSSELTCYCGSRKSPTPIDELLPYEAVVVTRR